MIAPTGFSIDTPESLLIEKQTINSLSREAIFVIQLIFVHAPDEATQMPMKEVTALLRTAGWKWITIWGTLAEIRKFLNDRNRSPGPYRVQAP